MAFFEAAESGFRSFVVFGACFDAWRPPAFVFLGVAFFCSGLDAVLFLIGRARLDAAPDLTGSAWVGTLVEGFFAAFGCFGFVWFFAAATVVEEGFLVDCFDGWRWFFDCVRTGVDVDADEDFVLAGLFPFGSAPFFFDPESFAPNATSTMSLAGFGSSEGAFKLSIWEEISSKKSSSSVGEFFPLLLAGALGGFGADGFRGFCFFALMSSANLEDILYPGIDRHHP